MCSRGCWRAAAKDSSDAAVVAAAIALFALITAAIHFSGMMQPGWSLF